MSSTPENTCLIMITSRENCRLERDSTQTSCCLDAQSRNNVPSSPSRPLEPVRRHLDNPAPVDIPRRSTSCEQYRSWNGKSRCADRADLAETLADDRRGNAGGTLYEGDFPLGGTSPTGFEPVFWP